MRRLLFIVLCCVLFCTFAPLSAQEQPPTEPQFTDAVEVLSVETAGSSLAEGEELVLYDGLVASARIILDTENRTIRTTDGEAYPFLDEFDVVSITRDNQTGGILIYQGNVFLQSRDEAAQQSITYWTLNLESGTYMQRETDSISTLCGDIRPDRLIEKWVFKIDENETRLCSLPLEILSSALPENYNWLWYDDVPLKITESPTGETLVFVGTVTTEASYGRVIFRYDIDDDQIVMLGSGRMYTDSNIYTRWLTDEIVLFSTSNHGANTSYAPILNLVDLRYNDVTVITGATHYTQENQINVVEDPLQIIVNDIFYVDLYIDDVAVEHIYCRDTTYDVLNRFQSQIDYGEFCHFVGGNRRGVGYYLLDGQLWSYRQGDSSAVGHLILDEIVEHVQLWDDILLLYTADQVLQLDTTVENAVPEVLFDHPALQLIPSGSALSSTNPFLYFITAEGLLRLNTETDEQTLLFAGYVSRVNWMDVDRGLVALVYQLIEDNFPPYIPPTIRDVDPWNQPGYADGRSALVNLETGDVIFETSISWQKMREWFQGSWENDAITDLGHGWFQPERGATIYVVSPEGELVDTVDFTDEFTPFIRAEDWLLVQDYTHQTLSLLNTQTDETILLGEGISLNYYGANYEGNGEFSLWLSNGKFYRIRVSQIID